MTERPWKISDLLALRDKEPHGADVRADDPEVIAALASVDRIQQELNALPDVPMDEAVWMQHMPAQHKRSGWLRFPLATAASVFFASVVGIYFVFGGSSQGPVGFDQSPQYVAQVPNNGMQLAGLMRQSRDLEQRLHGMNPLSQAADTGPTANQPARTPSRLEALLLFRLADVDGEIARLYDSESIDEQQRQRLWMKRVELLENLVAVQAGTEPLGAGTTRSM